MHGDRSAGGKGAGRKGAGRGARLCMANRSACGEPAREQVWVHVPKQSAGGRLQDEEIEGAGVQSRNTQERDFFAFVLACPVLYIRRRAREGAMCCSMAAMTQDVNAGQRGHGLVSKLTAGLDMYSLLDSTGRVFMSLFCVRSTQLSPP